MKTVWIFFVFQAKSDPNLSNLLYVRVCYLVYWSFPLENVSKMNQIPFVLQRERESWDFCLKIQFGTSLKRQGQEQEQEQEKIQFWTSSKRQQEEEGWRRISVENPILMQHQALPVGMKRFETDSCTFTQYQKTLQPWFNLFFIFFMLNTFYLHVSLKVARCWTYKISIVAQGLKRTAAHLHNIRKPSNFVFFF